MQLETPWWLAAFALIAPFAWWVHKKSYADLPPKRGRVALGLRLAGLALLLLAIAKPVLGLENKDRAILFLVDVSESSSTASLEDAWKFLERATTDRKSGERAGLVLFARRPELAIAPTREPWKLDPALERKLFHEREREELRAKIRTLERGATNGVSNGVSNGGAAVDETKLAELRKTLADVEAWRESIGSDETDLEAACRLARGLLPRETRRRVVLVSDGIQNRGDVLRELPELAREGFSLHTRLLPRDDKPEVVASELLVPTEAQVKAPFAVELAVSSSVATRATVKLFRNKYLVAARDVELLAGRNRLDLEQLTLEEGFHELEAIVEARDDTRLENNVARGAVRVWGRPKVLLVEREPTSARHLEQALDAEEIELEVRPISGVPQELGDLLNYEAVMLSDVEAADFAPGAMDALKAYVREYGGGLVMLGGEHSFGLGGYYRTPVEDALPVRMPIKKNVEKPNLALVCVVDKSGSMSGDKIELAKEAAIAAAEVLKKNDRFGVCAFDEAHQWICPMTEAADTEAITGTISRLVAGGGTHIYPALYEAWQALLDENAKLKHIIVMTDGQTTGSGYDTLVGHIAADGMTVSTVGIGQGASEQLLQDMASWGGGEYYFTDDPSSIPQIFTRETMRASKSMLVEEPFVPKAASASEVLKGIDLEAIPFLLGYVATQAKDTATVALVSDYGDPVLATWGYGLGRAAAFTSDAKARWAGDWISWDSFPKFWGQLVRSVMSTGAHRDLRSRTRVDIADGRAQITLDVRDRVGAFRDDTTPEISIAGAENEPEPLEVEHTAPGLYRASVPIERFGEFYRVLVVQKQDGAPVDVRALSFTESYSPEFKSAVADPALLRMLAERTGGAFAPADDAVWKFDGEGARTPHDTWWWWLVALALLFPLELALRRLSA